jgi:hypothetical protein
MHTESEARKGSGDPIREAASLLFMPGHVTEVRIPKSRRGVISGYFDDLDKLASAVAWYNSKVPGIYFTLNPVNQALLARAYNRLIENAKITTADTDILRRYWLPFDFDPKRPTDISSTDAEHGAALDRARECLAWLRSLGFVALISADSGNGGHVLARCDLPNDPDSTELVKRCIEAVAFRFGDDSVTVDLSVHNAARIWKVYGAWACKGDSLPDRPHRLARILEVSADLTPTPRELLERLAALVPRKPKQHARQTYNGRGTFDLARWITDHNLDVHGPYPWQTGQRWTFAVCPWNADHTNRGAAYLVQFANGAIAAGCHHNGCSSKDWYALRDTVEPWWRERRTANGHATDWTNLDDEKANAYLYPAGARRRLLIAPGTVSPSDPLHDGCRTRANALSVGALFPAWETLPGGRRSGRGENLSHSFRDDLTLSRVLAVLLGD